MNQEYNLKNNSVDFLAPPSGNYPHSKNSEDKINTEIDYLRESISKGEPPFALRFLEDRIELKDTNGKLIYEIIGKTEDRKSVYYVVGKAMRDCGFRIRKLESFMIRLHKTFPKYAEFYPAENTNH